MAIGRNAPRYSAGASGFMSQVSIWDAPPHRKNRIVDLAFPGRAADEVVAANAGVPKRSPAKPRLEATKNARRPSNGREPPRTSLCR